MCIFDISTQKRNFYFFLCVIMEYFASLWTSSLRHSGNPLYVIPGLTRNLVANHLSGYKIPGQARNDVRADDSEALNDVGKAFEGPSERSELRAHHR